MIVNETLITAWPVRPPVPAMVTVPVWDPMAMPVGSTDTEMFVPTVPEAGVTESQFPVSLAAVAVKPPVLPEIRTVCAGGCTGRRSSTP